MLGGKSPDSADTTSLRRRNDVCRLVFMEIDGEDPPRAVATSAPVKQSYDGRCLRRGVDNKLSKRPRPDSNNSKAGNGSNGGQSFSYAPVAEFGKPGKRELAGGFGGGAEERSCHICGTRGHLARSCPAKGTRNGGSKRGNSSLVQIDACNNIQQLQGELDGMRQNAVENGRAFTEVESKVESLTAQVDQLTQENAVFVNALVGQQQQRRQDIIKQMSKLAFKSDKYIKRRTWCDWLLHQLMSFALAVCSFVFYVNAISGGLGYAAMDLAIEFRGTFFITLILVNLSYWLLGYASGKKYEHEFKFRSAVQVYHGDERADYVATKDVKHEDPLYFDVEHVYLRQKRRWMCCGLFSWGRQPTLISKTLRVSCEIIAQLMTPGNIDYYSDIDLVRERMAQTLRNLSTVSYSKYDVLDGEGDIAQDSLAVALHLFESKQRKMREQGLLFLRTPSN